MNGLREDQSDFERHYQSQVKREDADREKLHDMGAEVDNHKEERSHIFDRLNQAQVEMEDLERSYNHAWESFNREKDFLELVDQDLKRMTRNRSEAAFGTGRQGSLARRKHKKKQAEKLGIPPSEGSW